ncbi:unnamed protein product, partial [marine sediment metagenome]
MKLLPADTSDISYVYYNKQILDQIYGVDINQFPAHLSVINIAAQNPKAKIDKVNIMVKDFFDIRLGVTSLSGFLSYSPKGGDTSVELPPFFDVLIGNPPYIEHELLGEKEKDLIKKVIEGEEITIKIGSSTKNKNRFRISKQSDIYVYFFIHGLKLLRSGGM